MSVLGRCTTLLLDTVLAMNRWKRIGSLLTLLTLEAIHLLVYRLRWSWMAIARGEIMVPKGAGSRISRLGSVGLAARTS